MCGRSKSSEATSPCSLVVVDWVSLWLKCVSVVSWLVFVNSHVRYGCLIMNDTLSYSASSHYLTRTRDKFTNVVILNSRRRILGVDYPGFEINILGMFCVCGIVKERVQSLQWLSRCLNHSSGFGFGNWICLSCWNSHEMPILAIWAKYCNLTKTALEHSVPSPFNGIRPGNTKHFFLKKNL